VYEITAWLVRPKRAQPNTDVVREDRGAVRKVEVGPRPVRGQVIEVST